MFIFALDQLVSSLVRWAFFGIGVRFVSGARRATVGAVWFGAFVGAERCSAVSGEVFIKFFADSFLWLYRLYRLMEGKGEYLYEREEMYILLEMPAANNVLLQGLNVSKTRFPLRMVGDQTLGQIFLGERNFTPRRIGTGNHCIAGKRNNTQKIH